MIRTSEKEQSSEESMIDSSSHQTDAQPMIACKTLIPDQVRLSYIYSSDVFNCLSKILSVCSQSESVGRIKIFRSYTIGKFFLRKLID